MAGKTRIDAKRSLLLVVPILWPILIGVVLDIFDFIILGDALQGAGWSFAGGIGVLTTSLPAVVACYLFRARSLHAHLFASLGVGGTIAALIATWATINMDPLFFGMILYLGAILVVVGACATGWMLWLIRRPDRDAPANPPTPTS